MLPAAIEQVRRRGGLVIAQLNRSMPYTLGDSELPTHLVDLAIEVDEPLPIAGHRRRARARRADRRARCRARADRATLQLGIGQVPDATLRALRSRRGLAIWSEMISDGVMALELDGALNGQRPIVCSFMFGGHDLYRWADRNPRVRMVRIETTTAPRR